MYMMYMIYVQMYTDLQTKFVTIVISCYYRGRTIGKDSITNEINRKGQISEFLIWLIWLISSKKYKRVAKNLVPVLKRVI